MIARGSAVMRALVLLAAIAAVGSSAWAAPAPVPTPMGLVSDFANAIDTQTKGLIIARLVELRRKTGAEIAVVTVPTTAPDTAFDYAMRLSEAWKPGETGKDNGVLFLVVVRDRAMFIAVGYGLEGALPDGLVGEVRDRDIVPHFRAGDLAGGVQAGVERLAQIIAKEYGVTLGPPMRPPEAARVRRPTSNGLGPLPLLLLMLFFFVILPAMSRGMGGGRRRSLWGPLMWGGGFGGGGFGGRGGGFGGGFGGGGGGGGGFGGFGGGGFGGGGAGGQW